MLALALLLALLLSGCAGVGGAPEPETALSPALTPEPTAPPEPEPDPTAPPAAEPDPTPEPTPEPDAAERLLADMTLWEKVCQMLVVRPTDLDPQSIHEAAPELAGALEALPVGGLFYQSRSMTTQDQVTAMIADTQALSGVPLLIACDEEGGDVGRLMYTVGTTWFNAMLTYKDQGADTARSNAETIGSEMAALGFNLELAPVADVLSNPANTVIGNRAYSDDFSQAAELIAAAVEGFRAGGVACTLKHFPGHGDTVADGDGGPARVTKTLDELRQEELLPFRAGIEAGAEAVMLGHLIVSDVTDEPAPFSPEIVTDLLREELGFSGVVLTDVLDTAALNSTDAGETARRAVAAGVDILLCPADPEAAAQALADAVEDGTLSEARIDESVLRILRLKLDLGLLE